MPMLHPLRNLPGLVMIGLLFASSVAAMDPDNCTVQTLHDPDRQVYSCSGGFVIEAEAGTKIGFAGPDGSIEVNVGAVLIEVEKRENAAQIRTPQAIAAVRGTVYTVTVSGGVTSVFVLRGQVEISHLEGAANTVLLGAGDGVDVTPGQPLDVKSWGDARVQNLMARFGR